MMDETELGRSPNGSGDASVATPRLADEELSGLAPLDRRERIARFVLRQDDVVLAKDLAAWFNVSLMTVHRDLDELEGRGLLRKVRGGATPRPSSLFESDVRFRMNSAQAEKEAVARYALRLIEPGQSILLDDATTTLALARILPSLAPITVITNFVAAINSLRAAEGVRLFALGGEYFPKHDSFLGVDCERAIGQLRADVFFLSTAAVSEGYLFHQEQEIVAVKRAMLAAATTKVLLLDHGKLGKVALHRLAPLADLDLVIVDDHVDEEGIKMLRDAKVPFELAPMKTIDSLVIEHG